MSASLPYANTPRSAQPIEWAALTVAAEMASAGDIRMARQAKEMAVCMFNDGVSQGLKFVAMATAAPASINARAGAGVDRCRRGRGHRDEFQSLRYAIVEHADGHFLGLPGHADVSGGSHFSRHGQCRPFDRLR